MTLDQVADLLKVLTAYDGRNVGEADLMVWGRQMDGLDFADAVEAIHQHYAEGDEWAKPSHIRARAERIRNARNVRPEVIAPGCYEPEAAERRRLAQISDAPAMPGPSIPAGLVACRDILDTILRQLHSAEEEESESDRIRNQAIKVARASKRGRKS